VRVGLDGGGTMDMSDDAVQRVYEELWALAAERGAVTTAAMLLGELRKPDVARRTVELTSAQSAVLRQAVSRIPGQ
jgi:hypothetical protein